MILIATAAATTQHIGQLMDEMHNNYEFTLCSFVKIKCNISIYSLAFEKYNLHFKCYSVALNEKS